MTAAYIVTQLQSIVSRDVAAADAGVVSVGVFNSGTALNVVADKAVLSGTSRSETPEIHEMIKRRMEEIAKGTEIAMATPVKFSFIEAPGIKIYRALF